MRCRGSKALLKTKIPAPPNPGDFAALVLEQNWEIIAGILWPHTGFQRGFILHNESAQIGAQVPWDHFRKVDRWQLGAHQLQPVPWALAKPNWTASFPFAGATLLQPPPGLVGVWVAPVNFWHFLRLTAIFFLRWVKVFFLMLHKQAHGSGFSSFQSCCRAHALDQQRSHLSPLRFLALSFVLEASKQIKNWRSV